jgi:hypothetical protein
LKRTVRTPNSEELAVFDADTRDEHGSAVNIGKIDLHFADDQVVGTLLLWQEYVTGYNRTHGPGSEENLDMLIDAILAEATEPVGVPGEYGIEVYYPSVTEHQFISNYEDDEDEVAEAEDAEQEEGQEPDFLKGTKR